VSKRGLHPRKGGESGGKRLQVQTGKPSYKMRKSVQISQKGGGSKGECAGKKGKERKRDKLTPQAERGKKG